MAENLNLKRPARPDDTAVLDAVKRDTMVAMNCVQVGIVQSFDGATQTAEIKIAMKQVVSIDKEGVKTLADYPSLVRCPCFVFQGGADFIGMPITAGDNCIILFNDRDLGQWMTAGPDQAPATIRVHDLSDAIAIVGIRPLTDAILGYITNGIRISHGGGNTKIDLVDNLIESTGDMFRHNGNMEITGNLTILGDTFGDGGSDINLKANLIQPAPYRIEAGNGATGNFNTVQVVKGIVVSGT